jgi:hypothetical protein
MTDQYKTAIFSKAVAKKCDDLPDHILQQINDACAAALSAAMIDKDRKTRDANIALGGMQKALALLIAKFFKPDQVTEITEQMCKAITQSIKDFS